MPPRPPRRPPLSPRKVAPAASPKPATTLSLRPQHPAPPSISGSTHCRHPHRSRCRSTCRTSRRRKRRAPPRRPSFLRQRPSLFPPPRFWRLLQMEPVPHRSQFRASPEPPLHNRRRSKCFGGDSICRTASSPITPRSNLGEDDRISIEFVRCWTPLPCCFHHKDRSRLRLSSKLFSERGRSCNPIPAEKSRVGRDPRFRRHIRSLARTPNP